MSTTSVGSSTSSSTTSPTSSVATTTPASTTSTSSDTTQTSAQLAAANKANAQKILTALGAGSGVDVTALAQNLVDAESAPQKNAINAKIAKNNTRISGYSAISYVVSQLNTAFTALKSQSSFNSVTASSTDNSSFTLTSGTNSKDSAVGTHSVTINQIAQAQQSYSTAFPVNATLNGGNGMAINLTMGGKTTALQIDPGKDTPQGVVDAINGAGKGITAQLINTGDPTNPMRIALSGPSGSANAFSMSFHSNGVISNNANRLNVSGFKDISTLSFSDLGENESVTVGGLTFTAGAGGAKASDIASAFSGLSDGANSVGLKSSVGTFSGTLSGFSAGNAIGNSVNFSSTASGNILPVSSTGTHGAFSLTTGSDSLLNGGQGMTISLGVVGSTPIAIPVLTDTPNGVVSAINAQGMGYTANIDSSGNLIINGPDGNSHQIAVQSDGNPGFSISSKISIQDPTQTAADAKLTVDGMQYVRNSNTITDIFPGLTLNVLAKSPLGTDGQTPTTASVSIARDTTTLTTNINNLVTAYNDAISMLNVVSDPKSTVDTYGASLVGDSTVQTIKHQLRSMFTSTSTATGAATSSVSALWQMGFSFDVKGVLSVDSTKLNTSLTNSFSDVVRAFTNNSENSLLTNNTGNGFAGDAVKTMTDMLGANGVIKQHSDNATTQNTKYQTDLTNLQTRMDALLVRYQKQFSAMDSIVGSINSQKTSLKSTFDGMMSMYTNKA